MYVTKELALRIESCSKGMHVQMAFAHHLGKVLEVGEGAACFAGFTSFFSQVVAWGFNLSAKQFKTQLQAIEQFYQALNHSRIDIELCPLVGNDLPVALSQLGYGISELNNVFFMDLRRYKSVGERNDLDIRVVKPNEFHQWANTIASGFGHMEAQEQFARYAGLSHVTVFAVYDHDKMVAGAAVAVHNDVADLGVTSTLPAYRNKGIQKLLLNYRLNWAHSLGIPLAAVTTEPGSISDLNVQKIGFHCAYTRLKCTRILKEHHKH